MRLIFGAITAVSILLGTMQGAQAQLGFVAGMILGSSMSGGSTVQGQESNPNVIYVAPRVAERVKDPLDLRFGWFSMRSDHGTSGQNMRQLFARALSNPKDADRFEIVQIIRIANQGAGSDPVMWFTFIEKEKLVALDKLPTFAEKQD